MLQAITLIVASIGGLVAAFMAIYQAVENRRQRVKELRWKQASLAKTILDELFNDPHAWVAAHVLDWSEPWLDLGSTPSRSEYQISTDTYDLVSYRDVIEAFQKEGTLRLNDKDIFIRESFDYFFYFIDRIEYYVNIDLIAYEDVKSPLKRYAEKMGYEKEAFENFMESQGYGLAIRFFRRFDDSPGPR